MMSNPKLIARSEPMPPQGGDKEGASPLAGHFGLASLLVRESVQNAWDARDDERGENTPVRFQIDGFDIDTDELEHLRTLIPAADLKGFERVDEDSDSQGILHPDVALQRDLVRILVISDRNTVGLCGPTHSGLEWEPVRLGKPLPRGQQRFANFVRNMGRATSDTGGGDGGSYGVGKSALWMASECGTILIHSRTTDEDGEPVERFIGTVHGEHFYSDGREFTGRHFIGTEGKDGLVEPLVRAHAAAAARGLPLPSYAADKGGEQVFGTSIVIVAPRMQFDWPTEMDRLRDAVRWHVWPKRVSGVRYETAPQDMDIRLGWNNHDVALSDPLDDPEIKPYAKALLDCARDRNSGEDGRDAVAQCHRPKKVLGVAKFRTAGLADDNVFHITLSESELQEASPIHPDEEELLDTEPAVDFDFPWGQIALIRREPLLLVRYELIGGPDAARNEVGVFLSADDAEVENALTKAEPPAHDDWISKIVPKDHVRDHRRTLAKRTIEEIRRAKQGLLASFRSTDLGSRGGGEQLVAKQLSSGLFGGTGGAKAPKKRADGGGAGVQKPRVVLSQVQSDQRNGEIVHELDVSFTGLGSESTMVLLTAEGSGRDNAGSIDVEGIVSYEWTTTDDAVVAGPNLETLASDETQLALTVRVAGDIRFRPRVKVSPTDAS